MFDENARGALIQHLGYVPEEKPAEVPAEVPEVPGVSEVPAEPVVEKQITAEDLFAAPSPMEMPAVQPAQPAEPVKPIEPVKAAEKEVVDTPAWSEAIKRCVVVGDFARAVDICFEQGRFADALMISMWGGDELLEQARVRPPARTHA